MLTWLSSIMTPPAIQYICNVLQSTVSANLLSKVEVVHSGPVLVRDNTGPPDVIAAYRRGNDSHHMMHVDQSERVWCYVSSSLLDGHSVAILRLQLKSHHGYNCTVLTYIKCGASFNAMHMYLAA